MKIISIKINNGESVKLMYRAEQVINGVSIVCHSENRVEAITECFKRVKKITEETKD